jgi:hypothetical protein
VRSPEGGTCLVLGRDQKSTGGGRWLRMGPVAEGWLGWDEGTASGLSSKEDGQITEAAGHPLLT